MEVQSERVVRMIDAAVLAGAYRLEARQTPGANGLLKLAEKWSDRAATLANEICARADGNPARALP